jgi:hypothetical protein
MSGVRVPRCPPIHAPRPTRSALPASRSSQATFTQWLPSCSLGWRCVTGGDKGYPLSKLTAWRLQTSAVCFLTTLNLNLSGQMREKFSIRTVNYSENTARGGQFESQSENAPARLLRRLEASQSLIRLLLCGGRDLPQMKGRESMVRATLPEPLEARPLPSVCPRRLSSKCHLPD